MKVLITGSKGQLGLELRRTMPSKYTLHGADLDSLDISDPTSLIKILQEQEPDVVINCAAYTAVDQAEQDQERAFAVNARGAGYLAKAAAVIEAKLIHISTDFVFDGTKSRPYLPDDEANPISVYGASKLEGERRVLANAPSAIVLRTAWLYSPYGSNFVKTMLRLMGERDAIKVIADQVGTPTWGGGLAQCIWAMVGRPDMRGIHHWTDAGVASWYDFAVAIQEFGLESGLLKSAIPIMPIRTEDYPTPAQRPNYSVLEKGHTWSELGGTAPHWRVSLRAVVNEIAFLAKG